MCISPILAIIVNELAECRRLDVADARRHAKPPAALVSNLFT